MTHLFLQGKEIIEYYLTELEKEGITHIPRWSPPSTTASPQLTVNIAATPQEDHERVHSNLTETPPASVEGRITEHSIISFATVCTLFNY